ncbi:MAG: hypothetical protein QM779_09275 [Propionicimonas sp.]|uniref:hypothetical protein n=1 Tax=Propionicimonas sp. TaxID=1955623 RepID=UPI003D0D48BD
MTARFSRWLRLVVATAAIAQALCLVLVWVVNLWLSAALVDEVGSDGIVLTLSVLGWVELVLGLAVLGGLVVGLWLHRPLWARGVATVTIGMVLHWGWWLVDRRLDLFGLAGMDAGDPAYLGRVEVRLWTNLGIDALAVIALVLGGILLLRHHPRDLALTRTDIADDEERQPDELLT